MKLRKLLERLKLISPKPQPMENNYLLWIRNGLQQANQDDKWRLGR